MIAVGMNGEPLPAEHGYPARLIVPGLYGYVSATKWLAEIELTTLEAFDGYWVPRGWAKEAPILTQSRIDVPRQGTDLKAGHVPVAGVAWAPDRGISKVEVRHRRRRLAAGAAVAADLEGDVGPVAATTGTRRPGQHVIEVRATDGTGEVQTDQATPPAARRRPRPPPRRRSPSAERPSPTRGTLGTWHGVSSSSISPTNSRRAPSASPAIAHSSCRPATAAA